MSLTLKTPPSVSVNGLIAVAKKIADDAASRQLNEQAMLGQHQEVQPKPGDVIAADPSLFVDAKVLVSINEIERRLRPSGQTVTPNPTASIVTANPTSIPTIKVATDTTTTTTTTSTTTTPSTWNPTATPTFTIFPTTNPSAAPSVPSLGPTVPSQGPTVPSQGPTTPSQTPTFLWKTETTRPTSAPSAFPTNTPSTTTTTTTSFVATIPPTSSPTPPTASPTVVGATFIPTPYPTPDPTSTPSTAAVYTSGPTGRPTLIAGSDKTSTTTTTTTPTTSTEFKSTTTAIAITTTPGGSATATSTTKSTPTPTSTPTSTPTPTLFASSTAAPTANAPNSSTTYGVVQNTTTTTTTTKPTTTILTSSSTTSTITSVVYDGKNTTSTTTVILTPTSSPTPKPSSIPTAAVFFTSSEPTNSPTVAKTVTPTFSMGTVPAPTPAAPLTPALPATPAPTDPNTTTNFATTPEGTTTVLTTTALPTTTTGPSNNAFLSTSFVPKTASTTTTTTTLLAATPNASNSTNKSLGWTNTTTTAAALFPQGTVDQPLSVVVKNNDQPQQLSIQNILTITATLVTMGGLATVATFQFVNWGNKLRDDIRLFEERAANGQLNEADTNYIQRRGASYANRVAYWAVNGKWGSFPNKDDANSLVQVMNNLVTTNTNAKNEIERLRGVADSLAAIVPSERPAISMMPQTIGSSGVFDLDTGQEQGRPLATFAVRAFHGTGSSPNLDEYEARRLGIDPPSIQAKEIPLIQTKDIRIVELWCLITKAQQLPYSDQSRTDMLMQALVKYQQIISSGNIHLYDFDTLHDKLMPTLLKELSDLTLMAADSDPSARLAGAQTLNVGHLPGTQFTWNANFSPSGGPEVKLDGNGLIRLMDISKPVFSNRLGTINQPKNDGYSKAAKSVVLDTQHSQYIASDANEFISIGSDPFATGPTNYNVAGMAGNDIFSISADSLGKNSYVNLFGGGGKNTYLIYGKGSWSQLASTIHIWDFDSSKDTIMFITSDGAINLNETKRTLLSSVYKYLFSNSEQVWLNQSSAKMSSVSAAYVNYAHSASTFKAAEHEFTGEGMPVIVVDERYYSTGTPNSIFSALKTSQLSNSNDRQLPLSEVVNTQFGKLDTTREHQQYKVHLTAGKSYVFTMSHSPYDVGNAVIVTSLTLKDAQNTTVANGKLEGGNSRIDYLAIKDGDFYLDASGSLPAIEGHDFCPIIDEVLSSYQGKYAISTIEIPHLNVTPPSPDGSSYLKEGNFDGLINHLGFKISLTAGDYVDVNFNSYNSSPNMQITDPNGRVASGFHSQSKSQYVETFLAQNSGDYLFDFTPGDRVTSGLYYSLTTTKNKDIEGSKDTDAILSINTVITSKLFNQWDHDWFRVNLEANKKYQFDLHKVSIDSNLDTFLTLRDSNGSKLAFNDDYVDIDDYNQDPILYRDSQLIYTAKTSGHYFIDASSNLERSSGAYTLSYKVI